MEYKPLYDAGNGEPIVLLHGLFGNLSNWKGVADQLSSYHRVLIPRLPLYADTFSASRLEGLVNYLEKFIDQFDFDRVTLMGNSLGGHVALLYAWRNPKRMRRLVLTGSSGLFENSFSGGFPRIRDYEYIHERVRDTFQIKEVVTQELVDEVFETVQSRTKTISLIGLAREAQRKQVRDQLTTIDTPTLLIWGLQDRITPPETAIEFHNLLPNAELVFLDDCGHVPMMEQPEQFFSHITRFLKLKN